jgi:hypothetical protein
MGVAILFEEPPPLRKFDNIFTGDGGRNCLVLSPSGLICNALRMFEYWDTNTVVNAGFPGTC